MYGCENEIKRKTERESYTLQINDFIPGSGMDRYTQRNSGSNDFHVTLRGTFLAIYNAGCVIVGLIASGAVLGGIGIGVAKGIEYLINK